MGENDKPPVRSLSGGVNQSGVRDFNERLLLSMIQRYGSVPASELARLASLSPQTVSVILRKLEHDGLILRGAPVRGKVGKPTTPVKLDPDGVLSIGLKIGRRSAALILIDFQGGLRKQLQFTYRYPTPANIFGFIQQGMRVMTSELNRGQIQRLAGIGIAIPHELWNWHELVGAPAEEFKAWQEIDFHAEIARFSPLPVLIVNDATAACRAEHVFGRGREYRDYAYFYVGAFVGGGVVLNHAVFEGSQANAGAFGALRSIGPDGKDHALIDTASIFVLENALAKAGIDASVLWAEPQNWASIQDHLTPWTEQVGRELAKAANLACAVIDFEAVIIDGAFPADVRDRIVEIAQRELAALDTRGIIAPTIVGGSIGGTAREMGAASTPIFNTYLLNAQSGLSAT